MKGNKIEYIPINHCPYFSNARPFNFQNSFFIYDFEKKKFLYINNTLTPNTI